MKVNPVNYKDIDRIYELEKATFDENVFTRDLFKKLVSLNLLFLKLEKGLIKKRIIGFVIIIKDKKDRANLINFLIDNSYHNEGLGTFLLQHAIDLIKTDYPKINTIVLNVQINNSAAIHLYEKFNFKIVEKIEDYYRTGDSAYVMKLTV